MNENRRMRSSIMGNESFLQAIERQLQNYPQIGAIVLEGVLLACKKATSLIRDFEEELTDKLEEIRNASDDKTSSKSQSRSKQTTSYTQ